MADSDRERERERDNNLSRDTLAIIKSETVTKYLLVTRNSPNMCDNCIIRLHLAYKCINYNLH